MLLLLPLRVVTRRCSNRFAREEPVQSITRITSPVINVVSGDVTCGPKVTTFRGEFRNRWFARCDRRSTSSSETEQLGSWNGRLGRG